MMIHMNQGDPVDPFEILDQRELRASLLEDLAKRFPKDTLVCFKLNIPGPIKNNDLIAQVFDDGVERIKQVLPNPTICSVTVDKTGPELILHIAEDSRLVKEKMIKLEESSPVARLYDIDVLYKGIQVSREALGRPQRPCFLCNNPAKACARSGAHQVNDLLEAIEQMILADPRFD